MLFRAFMPYKSSTAAYSASLRCKLGSEQIERSSRLKHSFIHAYFQNSTFDLIFSLSAFILQFEFQSLFSTAGKPKVGLYITIAAGLTNIVLDALFVAVFSWGLEGAAAATVISQCVGGGVPILYFARRNDSFLRLGKTSFDGKSLVKICSNGFSELLSQISMSLVSMLYNVQLLRYAGADGVAAYGVLMYVGFIFQALFIGYSVGTAPIIGYHYGAQNHKELKSLLKRSGILIGIFALCMFASSLALSRTLASIFVGYDAGLFAMTVHAFGVFRFFFRDMRFSARRFLRH